MHQVEWNDKISVDDIVLVKLMNRPRPHWVLGRVLELIRGHDQKVRSVKIQRGDGSKAKHSICHLYPMELSLSHNPKHPQGENSQLESEPAQSHQSASVAHNRPRRSAATTSRGKVKGWAHMLRKS